MCGEGADGRRLQETGENSDLYWLADGVKKVGMGGARGTSGKEELRKEIDYLEDLGLDVRIILK